MKFIIKHVETGRYWKEYGAGTTSYKEHAHIFDSNDLDIHTQSDLEVLKDRLRIIPTENE